MVEICEKKLNSSLRPGLGTGTAQNGYAHLDSSLLFLRPALFLRNKATANTVNDTLGQGTSSRPGGVLSTL